MKTMALITFLTVLFISALAGAQEQEGYVKDLMEINFFGGGGVPSGDIKVFRDSVGVKSGYNFGFDAGFLITESWVAGLNFTYTGFKVDEGDNVQGLHHKLYSPNLYLKYYLSNKSDFVPYLKAQGGIAFPKFTTLVANSGGQRRYRELSYDAVVSYGAGVGLFIFTTDYSGLFVEGNYYGAVSRDAKVNYQGTDYFFNSDLSMIDIHVGIRVLIGGSSE